MNLVAKAHTETDIITVKISPADDARLEFGVVFFCHNFVTIMTVQNVCHYIQDGVLWKEQYPAVEVEGQFLTFSCCSIG